MPTGLLMRSTGSRYIVRGSDGVLHTCIAKGKLRIKGYSTTNPLAVGDIVEFDPAAEKMGNEIVGAVTELHHRRNYLVRKSVNLSHHKHVIASNMDQCLVLVTLARPRTSYGFIDRVLVTAEAYRIPPVIIFNKVDDYDDDELGLLAEYEDVYQGAGYRTLITSALKNVGMEEVKELLKGKVSLLVGHSGVGKSTLVNSIDPSLDLHTLEISASTDKGQHTTTAAEMFELQLALVVGSRESGSRESASGQSPITIHQSPPPHFHHRHARRKRLRSGGHDAGGDRGPVPGVLCAEGGMSFRGLQAYEGAGLCGAGSGGEGRDRREPLQQLHRHGGGRG